MTDFVYLATPYSKYRDGLEGAFRMACRQAAVLIRAGIHCYSPIAHTHPISQHGGIDPYDHSIWLPADRPFMEAAFALVVVMADGWEQSFGIDAEIKAFYVAGKPVFYMTPDQAPEELLL